MIARRLAALALVCAWSTASLYAIGYSKSLDFRAATPEERAMTGVPFAPGASAAILYWARVDDDRVGISSEYFRIKVFSEEGKKYGDIEIPYTPGYPLWGRISELEVRTIQPDGKISWFTGKVYDKVLYKSVRGTVHAKTFSIQDIQPGSIIEYRYERRWDHLYLFDTTWEVQRDIPVLHADFAIRAYPSGFGDYSTLYTISGLPPGKAPQKNGERYELALENMPAFVREELAPPESELKARVQFYYVEGRVKPDDFWPAEVGRVAKEIRSFLGDKPRGTAEWTAGATTPLEKLRQIYMRVQSMRNISFEVEKTEKELARQDIKEAGSAVDVLRNKAGTRDELNRLFVAAARVAGFDADVLRVAPRDENFFSMSVPDSDQMSAEVAVVMVDGKPMYLDPGTIYAPFGTVSWEKTNVPAIRSAKDGKAEWSVIPGTFPADALTRRIADLKMNGETLEGTVTVMFTGQEALVRRIRYHGEDAAARKKALEEEAKGWFAEGTAVTLKQVTGDQSADDALVADFAVSMPNVIARAGSRIVLPISIFAANATNPFAPAERTHAIYFDYPSRTEDRVKVTLAPGMTVATLPPPSNLNAGALSYSSEATATETEVNFQRTMSLDAMLVDRKYYPALRKFYSDVLAADQKPVLLGEAR
ncbi:MAG: hypothetical protein QOH21_3155 [Acidobacteriota bacterium]|nr:hypothetical protein [Acidobacteriota bacterium]